VTALAEAASARHRANVDTRLASWAVGDFSATPLDVDTRQKRLACGRAIALAANFGL
jgi:hypothetical protein